jgi:hypothetical protein
MIAGMVIDLSVETLWSVLTFADQQRRGFHACTCSMRLDIERPGKADAGKFLGYGVLQPVCIAMVTC